MKIDIPAGAVAAMEKLDSYIKENTIVVYSPGRINVIGEHTDYNEGFVLPAAIDKAAYIAITPREDDEIHLYGVDMNGYHRTTVSTMKPVEDESWPNYMLGVVDQFVRSGIQVPGFDAALTGDIPIGAGLSSSAAVECAMAMGLNQIADAGFDRLTLTRMAQLAEHTYAGVQCGIMDQFASMFGKKGYVIRLDCRSLAYEYVPFNLEGMSVVLLDTNVKHSLASTEYNTRREQCEHGVALVKKHHPKVESLRDVRQEWLDQYVKDEDPLAYRRCRFVLAENQRLLDACAALEKQDIGTLGKLMYAAHDGLSREYEVSCPELDFLVDFVRQYPAIKGARMMGGGFGGCTINIIEENAVESVIGAATEAYNAKMGRKLTAYVANTDTGTTIIQQGMNTIRG